MECPLCKHEATLYAETKPNGKIGVFCRNCRKGYYTLNPDNGWEVIEYDFSPPKSLAKMEQAMAAVHNIDMTEETLNIAELEFKAFVTGEWRLE